MTQYAIPSKDAKDASGVYFVAGKRYPIIRDDGLPDGRFGLGFYVLGENGLGMYCLERECAHLGGKKGDNWQIVEED